MIAIFAYRLIKTDFLGGWKKSAGEYATGTCKNYRGESCKSVLHSNFSKNSNEQQRRYLLICLLYTYFFVDIRYDTAAELKED